MKFKKLLAFFLVFCILATSLFTNSVFANAEYDLEDVNELAQHLAGWDIEVNEGTLDYNCDGRVNLKDLVLLAQFVAGWNVVIGNGSNNDAYTHTISANVTAVDNKVPAGGVVIADDRFSAVVPEGVLLNPGTTTLTLKLTYLNHSAGGVVAGENEELVPLDVHVEGVSKANTVPIIINLGKVLPEGLNLGNYKFFHVEDGEAKVMTLVDSADALTAHNTFTYNATTGEVSVAMATFSPVIVAYDTTKVWNGGQDDTWYDKDATELTIANGDQLYSFSKIVGGMAKDIDQDSFNGKTIKLVSDIDFNHGSVKEGGISKIFYPVGYYNSDDLDKYDIKTGKAITSGFYTFEGTFDGNGHTISNVYQNTWEMKGDHDWYSASEQNYRDGMGIFGKVYGGTVKNLTVDNFESDGEIATTGVIAAYADGATFENISITNCNPRVYNIGNGGIVGCVGWYAKEPDLKTTFKNITVDNSNKISALWGSYDVACGGIVGQYYPTSGQTSAGTPKNAGISLENCYSAAQMDVYNDVCANYQYYAYRYTGILIGSVRENETIDGRVYPKMEGITATNCAVHYGDWNDYYYCELVANSLASYTHDHQFSRLEQVANVDVENMTITPLKGNSYTVPTSGRYNYVVVNGEHATENATCYHFVDGKVWNHEDAGTETVDGEEGVQKEDKQHIYLEFNNLVTGYGWGVTSKGVEDMEEVTILDHEGSSVDKFAYQDNYGIDKAPDTTYATLDKVTVGELFKEIADVTPPIMSGSVQVFISPAGEGSTVEATYTANAEDWTKGTIKFDNGVGFANITITDYYFCNSLTLTVNVTPQPAPTQELNELTYDEETNTGNWHMLYNAKDSVNLPEKEIPHIDSNGDGKTIEKDYPKYIVPDSESHAPTQIDKLSGRNINMDTTYGRTDSSSILMSLSNKYVYVKLPDLKDNTDYTLTFYYSGTPTSDNYIFEEIFLFTPYKENAEIKVGGYGVLYAEMYTPGKSYAFKGYTTPNGNNKQTIFNLPPVALGKGNWNKVEINFNSCDYKEGDEEIYLVLDSDSASTINDSLKWIDDISLVETPPKTAANDPSLWTSYFSDYIGTNESSNYLQKSYTTTDYSNIFPGAEGSLRFITKTSAGVVSVGSLVATPLNTEAGKSYKISFKYKSDSKMCQVSGTNKYVYIRQGFVATNGGSFKDDNYISATAYNGYSQENKNNVVNPDNTTALDPNTAKGKWHDFELEFTATTDEQLYFAMMLLTTTQTEGNEIDVYISNFKVEELA